jgi:hypothetical protein
MSGPGYGDSLALPQELVEYYRTMLKAHADDPLTGECFICHDHHCLDWRYAYTMLTSAGEL